MRRILNYLFHNKNKIWYMLCFLMLGIIDQRRESAAGTVQIAAVNCTGLVLAAMLLPSVGWGKAFLKKRYLYWTAVAAVLGIAASIWGWNHWPYHGQWITGVMNVAAWGYFVIYLISERKNAAVLKRIKRPFLGLLLLFLLMILSVHEGILPIWMLLMFGCFYLVGIPKENRGQFFEGMLNGIILWFFVQQTVAFAFRPYDTVRYHSMYANLPYSGVFYMIVYCAFLCKWMLARERRKNRFIVFFYFFMSAASISFLLFTGGRSSLMGAAVATLLLYVIHDIVLHKSVSRWLMHILLFGLCVVISFPLVYGAIRYFPTILHHPIWFSDEYIEESSVRSFDSWDSDRYVSFEEAVKGNIGRIVSILGVDISKMIDACFDTPFALKVYAAEKTGPGTSPDNLFELPGSDRSNPVSLRKTIFACYLYYLNLRGHRSGELTFYVVGGYVPAHSHNMFIQIAFDYGIPAGILFLGLILYGLIYFIRLMVKRPEDIRWVCLPFLAAIVFYGLTELPIIQGTITWTLLYLLLCFVGEESTISHKTTEKV